jgi:hypothetical protein
MIPSSLGILLVSFLLPIHFLELLDDISFRRSQKERYPELYSNNAE